MPPALLPALSFTVGTVFAALAPVLSLPGLLLLGAGGVALGGEAGAAVACGAAGALNAAVRWVLPGRDDIAVDHGRPVQADLLVDGYAVRSSFGWAVPVSVSILRQGGALGELGGRVELAIPESVRPPWRGERLRASGYLRRGAGFANDPPTAPGGWRLAVKTNALLRRVAPPPAWLALGTALRSRFDTVTQSGELRHAPANALARALLVGDTSAIPDAWRRALRRAGLLHLLAVSGFNVSLVVALAWLLTARLPRLLRLAVAGAVLVLYVMMVGPLASVLRAGVMGSLFLAALLLRRPPVAANALAVATVILLLFDPALIEDLGFQLTVAATAGLVFLAPGLARRWAWMPALVRGPLAVSWAAQLATLPWALWVFLQVHPGAFLFNLVFVPWAAIAMIADLVWAMLAMCIPGSAATLGWIPSLVAAPFEWLTQLPAGRWLVWPLAVRDAGWVIVAAAALTWAAGSKRRLGIATIAVAVGSAGLSFVRATADAGVEARFFDVGQGDATLLRGGGGSLLIDGGGWQHGDLGGTVLLPALSQAGIQRLDALVMTHPDADHCRGLVDIADYLPARELWLGAGDLESECARQLLGRAGLTARLLSAGDVMVVGSWRLEVLSPPRLPALPTVSVSDNNRSLVLLASAAGRSFLLTGDIERVAEWRLLSDRRGSLAADVLKVAHHGSRTSSDEAFLDAVAPRLAVISAGLENRFGHPSADVVERFARRGVRLRRTDRDGEIVLRWSPGAAWSLGLPAAPRGAS